MLQVGRSIRNSDFGLLVAISLSCALIAGCSKSATTHDSGSSSATAPQISTQPASQSSYIGDSATFTVSAVGTAPLTYDWRKNGMSLNATSSVTYATPALAATDDGASFTVVVSNSAGSVVSSAAKLSVSARAPQITTPPRNITIAEGKDATFSVACTGTAPLQFQWLLNGTAISGATAASYTFPAAKYVDSGKKFSVTVSNNVGAVTSPAATLTVTSSSTPISINTQPADATQFTGETATSAVVVKGTTPAFQWRRNGDANAGETSLTYTTPLLAAADDKAVFDVVVTNEISSVASATESSRINPLSALRRSTPRE